MVRRCIYSTCNT